MQTKELIALLAAEDPSGELEVSVGNMDIHFVAKEPAYYDGCLQVLKRDCARDGYNITGAEYRSKGCKIVIKSLSVRDAVWENPDLPVAFDSPYAEENYASVVADWRDEARV